MENIQAHVETIDQIEYLVLRINLSAALGHTRGGHNVRIASSLGNQPVPSADGRLRAEKWNLNVFRPKTPRERFERRSRVIYPGESDSE